MLPLDMKLVVINSPDGRFQFTVADQVPTKA